MLAPRSLALLLSLAACASPEVPTAVKSGVGAMATDCEPHITAWLADAPLTFFYDLEGMRASRRHAHFVRLTDELFAAGWLQQSVERLAVTMSTSDPDDHTTIVEPSGGTVLAGHEVGPGYFSNRETSPDEPTPGHCASEFDGVVMWARLESTAIEWFEHNLDSDPRGFEPQLLTVKLTEDGDALRLSVALSVVAPEVAPAEVDARRQEVESDLRRVCAETMGQQVDFDLQLTADEWRGTLVASDDQAIAALIQGFFAVFERVLSVTESAAVVCNGGVDALHRGGNAAVSRLWSSVGLHPSTRRFICMVYGMDTSSQPSVLWRYADIMGLPGCPLADVLEASGQRLTPGEGEERLACE